MDPHVHMREPGVTESETIKTGSMAAARGGYTQVFLMPNTNPVISDKESLKMVKEIIEKDSVIEALPLASITIGEAGKELVNFDELDVVGFSDGFDGIRIYECGGELKTPLHIVTMDNIDKFYLRYYKFVILPLHD